MAHDPLLHAGTELGGAQFIPQPPQFEVEVVVLISQPFDAMWSQSAKPELQLAIAHVPPLQVGVAFGVVQTMLQPPQLLTSVWPLMLQPVVYLPSQFRKPVLQGPRPQTPLLQSAVPFCSEHTVPHMPQFCVEVVVLTSQPSATCRSQSAKPELHTTMVHAPAAQPGVALGVLQTLPQPSQFIGSVLPLTSQPSFGSWLQSK
jgi:hypothetical protein